MSAASSQIWRRHLVLLTLMLCTICSTSLRPQPATGIAGLVQWVTAVDLHVPGTSDEPAVVVASWSRRDLASLFPYIRAYFDVLTRGPSAPRRTIPQAEMDMLRTMAPGSVGQKDPLRFAKRAAMLHVDIAIAGIDRRAPAMLSRRRGVVRRPPDGSIPERSYATGVDGQYQGDGEAEGHWDAGRTILDFVRPPAPDPDILLWYRTGAAVMMAQGNLAEALPHLRHGLSLFPADARLLFSSGCLYEVLASPRIQRIVQRVQAAGGQVAVEDEEGNLERAERFYRRALDADTTHTESRIRLGRVLSGLGKAREAATFLRPPSSERDQAIPGYYRALFLGNVEDELGDHVAAEKAYREAARLFPAAQSPRLSLALLAIRGGDRQALSSILGPLRGKGSDVSTNDPWWVYGLCEGRDVKSLMTQLRQAIGEASR